MVGENNVRYRLEYTEHFRDTLRQLIYDWEHVYELSEDKISRFTGVVEKVLRSLCTFPEMYQEVSQIYGFLTPTYRILIGKYACFYRIDRTKKLIIIGSIFNQKQMKVRF